MSHQGDWSTPRARGPRPESPVAAGKHCEPSNPGPDDPRELVDTADPRTRAQVARDSWSRARVLGQGPESPGRDGRSRGPSDPGSNSAHILGRPRPPRTHGPRADSARTTVRPRGPSQKGQSRPGQLFNPTSAWTLVRVGRESWLAPCNLGPGTEWAGIAGRPHST